MNLVKIEIDLAYETTKNDLEKIWGEASINKEKRTYFEATPNRSSTISGRRIYSLDGERNILWRIFICSSGMLG